MSYLAIVTLVARVCYVIQNAQVLCVSSKDLFVFPLKLCSHVRNNDYVLVFVFMCTVLLRCGP